MDAKTPELGATPLMRAVQQCHLLVVRLLISYGADLELVNSNHENVFHILAKAAVASSSSSSSSSQNQGQGQDPSHMFLELARWLKMKAKSQPGRFQRMLKALDQQEQRPLDLCLQDRISNTELVDILTQEVVTAHQD